MTARQLEEFRTLLTHLLERTVSQQLAEVQRGTEVDPQQDEPRDVGDEAERVNEREDRLIQGERAALLAMKIEGALERITRGEYGICVDCGREIELDRLRAVPWAIRCADDKAAREFDGTDRSPSL